MQALSPDDRIHNKKKHTAHCHVCLDDATIVIGTHVHAGAEYENYGPCPFCDRGLAVEFSEKTKWGPDGFWRGQDLPDDLVALFVESSRPAPPLGPAAQKAELAKLIASVNLGTMEP